MTDFDDDKAIRFLRVLGENLVHQGRFPIPVSNPRPAEWGPSPSPEPRTEAVEPRSREQILADLEAEFAGANDLTRVAFGLPPKRKRGR